MATVTKLGAAILASTIPFATIGCSKKDNTPVNNTTPHISQTPQIKYTSGAFPYKRDEGSGRIFIGDTRAYKKDLPNVGMHEINIRALFAWQQSFNNKAFNLEQRVIDIEELPKSPEPVENKLISPKETISVYPFVDPFENKEIKESNFLLIPYGNYPTENKMPIAVNLNKPFKFISSSLERRHYIHKHSDGRIEIKEGIHFKVNEAGEPSNEEDKGWGLTFPICELPVTMGIHFKPTESQGKVLEITIPLENCPIAITTNKKMYLIGLDSTKIGIGKFGVTEQWGD